jgi:DNA-binding transcriptional LysR family regulator
MELRQLRHLIAVVEHGSFSRAAEAVHLTQPALSRSIQALEAEVGAAVLDRNRGAIVPTDVGQLLLTHARLLDTATRDLERDIALTQGLALGELRIGVGPYGGSALVGPPIGQLNLAHPGLRLKTVLAPWQELPDRARARDVDLIVVELSQVQQMQDFAVQGLTEHAMVPVCQPRHPLTLMASPTLADVFSYPVAGPSLTPALTAALQNLFPLNLRAQQHKRGLLAVECDLSGMLKDVLRNSHAISLMPAFMVAAEVAAGQLVCVPGVELGLRVRFGCAWLKARTLSPVTARFMELLAAHDRGLAALAGPAP